jgi:hypothetical protein
MMKDLTPVLRRGVAPQLGDDAGLCADGDGVGALCDQALRDAGDAAGCVVLVAAELCAGHSSVGIKCSGG